MKKSSLLLISAALLTGIALFYAWTDWHGARQLKSALAMLEAKHEPILVEDFIPAPIPDERNVAAAPIFKEIFTLKQDARLEKLILPWQLDIRHLKHMERESTLHFKARQISPSFVGNDTAAAQFILTALEPSTPLLSEIREALTRPEVVWPLDFSKLYATQLPQVTVLIRIAHMIQARALAEMATGSPEKAFEDTKTLLTLAQVSKEPHYLICELVELSILNMASEVIHQALDHESWSDVQLATISAALSQPKLLSQYAESLRLERILLFQLDLSNPEIWRGYQSVTDNPAGQKGFDALVFKILQANVRLRPTGWNSEDKAINSTTIQQLIESLSHGENLASPEIWDTIQEKSNHSVWAFFRAPFSSELIPNVTKTIKKFSSGQTTLNSLSAACAVERYRLAHHQLPSSLDELVPAFLPSVPKDPMTGDPLHYKTSPDGSFVIYGLGWNRKDEGGPKLSTYNKKPEDQTNWGIVVTTPK